MARYTSAYSSFADGLAEVRTLRRLAAAKEKLDPIGLAGETNALCRGAVVLLSARLEAYIKEIGELALDSLYMRAVPRTEIASQFYYHLSRDLLSDIRDTAEPARVADKVFLFIERDAAQWSRSGPFPEPLLAERFADGFANPKYDKICKYFKRFGYGGFHADLARMLRARFTATTNMVDHVVDTRNSIAHGDLTASKTPGEVAAMEEGIQVFCRATDAAFATWWRSEFCAIR